MRVSEVLVADIDTRLFDAYANGWTFGLILAIALFIFAAVQIRAWYHDQSGPADDDETFLLALHDSRREGVVTPDEFRSIQSKLSVGSPAPAASPNAPDTNDAVSSEEAAAEAPPRPTPSEPNRTAEPPDSMRKQNTTAMPSGEPPA